MQRKHNAHMLTGSGSGNGSGSGSGWLRGPPFPRRFSAEEAGRVVFLLQRPGAFLLQRRRGLTHLLACPGRVVLPSQDAFLFAAQAGALFARCCRYTVASAANEKCALRFELLLLCSAYYVPCAVSATCE